MARGVTHEHHCDLYQRAITHNKCQNPQPTNAPPVITRYPLVITMLIPVITCYPHVITMLLPVITR